MEQQYDLQRKCRLGCTNYDIRRGECKPKGATYGEETKPGSTCLHPELFTRQPAPSKLETMKAQ